MTESSIQTHTARLIQLKFVDFMKNLLTSQYLFDRWESKKLSYMSSRASYIHKNDISPQVNFIFIICSGEESVK